MAMKGQMNSKSGKRTENGRSKGIHTEHKDADNKMGANTCYRLRHRHWRTEDVTQMQIQKHVRNRQADDSVLRERRI